MKTNENNLKVTYMIIHEKDWKGTNTRCLWTHNPPNNPDFGDFHNQKMCTGTRQETSVLKFWEAHHVIHNMQYIVGQADQSVDSWDPDLFQNWGCAVCSFGNKYMKRHPAWRREFLHCKPHQVHHGESMWICTWTHGDFYAKVGYEWLWDIQKTASS